MQKTWAGLWQSLRNPSRPDLPTAAESAPLPFDEVWEWLIGEVEELEVVQLRLTVARQGQISWEEVWNCPQWGDDCGGCWSVTVSFPKRDGQVCELRASLAGASTPAHHRLSALTGILKTFGIRFAMEREAGVTFGVVHVA